MSYMHAVPESPPDKQRRRSDHTGSWNHVRHPARALLVAGSILIASGSASARTWLVLIDGTGDAPTIQAAVDSAAADGDSILVGPGTYLENVQVINKGLLIASLAGRDQTTIQGATALRLTGNLDSNVIGLTLTGSVGAEDNSRSTFESCAFKNCGTGARIGMGQSSVFNSCIFSANLMGLHVTPGDLYGARCTDCEFHDNGIGAEGGSSFINCKIWGNTGNAVVATATEVFQARITRLTNCEVFGNGGYGVVGRPIGLGSVAVRVDVIDTEIKDNSAGGIQGDGFSSFLLTDSELSGNDGPAGIALHLELTRSVVWANAGGLQGIPYRENSGGVHLVESTYHANGAGITAMPFVPNPARITVTRSIVSGTLSGRGLSQCGGPLLILSVNCTDTFGNAGGDDVCQAAGADNFSLDPLFCDAASGDFTLGADSPCAPANSPSGCDLIGALPVGCQTASIAPGEAPHQGLLAAQNRPNPFNPTTAIPFTLQAAAPVTLRIFNSAGKHVRTLVEEPLPAGDHVAVWDGRNADGESVASGVYTYRIEASGVIAGKRMVLVK